MDKAISENKLHQQHSRMEMRFSSKEKLFLADEIKNLLQRGKIRVSNVPCSLWFQTWKGLMKYAIHSL